MGGLTFERYSQLWLGKFYSETSSSKVNLRRYDSDYSAVFNFRTLFLKSILSLNFCFLARNAQEMIVKCH